MKLSLVVTIGVVLCKGVIANARGGFNRHGNILITDQFNNRVIEIDPAGNIVWHFGNGPNDVSANSIIGTNDAERVGGLTQPTYEKTDLTINQTICERRPL